MSPNVAGIALALIVGFVLGLLGGGGSILAVPIFLFVLHVPTKPAIAMSLAVVGLSAFIGFLSHWRQGTVCLRVGVSFGAFAMCGAFVGARLARLVPANVQLALFAAFACTAAILMLRDSLRTPAWAAVGMSASTAGIVGGGTGGDPAPAPAHTFTPSLALSAFGVGVLTALVGAGGGFMIVPALVLIAKVPVKEAVGSSLLVITMNALSGFAGYLGQVPIDWMLVSWFSTVAAIGVLVGTSLVPIVPQARLKQAFAVMILALGAYFVVSRL